MLYFEFVGGAGGGGVGGVDTKLERFLPKNQPTQRKLLNFENWVNMEVSKSANFYVKNYPNLSNFFLLKKEHIFCYLHL